MKTNLDEISIKDAFNYDMTGLRVRFTTCIDPAPPPFIPLVPIVVGAKAIKRVKNIIESIR